MSVPEILYSDVGPTDSEFVLVNSQKNVTVTFNDSNGNPANPAVLSVQLTDLGGRVILQDVYLPSANMSPNPPRIINPSVGVFEFPLGQDNGNPDNTQVNRTSQFGDMLMIWRAQSVAPVNAHLTIGTVLANTAIVWTAVAPGTPGDFIHVQYINPGTPSAALSLVRSGALLTVNLATDSGSAITTVANDIITAVQANAQFSQIVTVASASGSTGAGVVSAFTSAPLAGGVDGSPELVVTENVSIVPHRLVSLIPKLRLMIDKAVKFVKTNDTEDNIFLGYTDGQLIKFLLWGIQAINSYQPEVVFNVFNYPYNNYEFMLIESALMTGVMSQELFAVDTDVPNFNDQGNSFVIAHAPQLVTYLNMVTQRLDKMIPLMKLNFVRSGSIHIEAGPNYRLQQLLSAAPSGSLFRNVFVAAP